MNRDGLYLIDAKHFYAAIWVQSGKVRRAPDSAPITKSLWGMTLEQVKNLCGLRGWKIKELGADGPGT